jgi:hypothetical protein
MPPKSTPGACTKQQLEQDYALCGGSLDYSEVKCRAFEEDPANAAGLSCLFSASGDASSGAVLVLPAGRWLANIGGCEALLDGDSSQTSCGARHQAADVCKEFACAKACARPVSNATWQSCLDAADLVCFDYLDQDTCSSLPRYALCHQMGFQAYFTTFGNLFCGAGLVGAGGEPGVGGASGEAGASGAGGASL